MPLAPRVLELSDQLLLLGVDADRGLTGGERLPDAVVDVAKLGVTIGMLLALERLASRLQAKAELAFEQASDEVLAGLVALGTELLSEVAHALGGPQQHPLRIAPDVIPDQRPQSVQQLRIAVLGRGASSTLTPNPVRSERLRLVKLHKTLANRVLRQPTRPRRRRDSAIPKRASLRGSKAPPLPLIQSRRHQPVALRDRRFSITHASLVLHPHPTVLHLIYRRFLSRAGRRNRPSPASELSRTRGRSGVKRSDVRAFVEKQGRRVDRHDVGRVDETAGPAGGELRGRSDLSRNTRRRIRAGLVISAEATV